MKTQLFKIGDDVSVLDDDLTGQIISISGNTISILTEDGFELDFDSGELIILDDKKLVFKDIFKNESLQKVVSEKEVKKRQIAGKKSKERYEPTLEVDLHIHQLTDSTRGMTNYDMLTLQLDTARNQLEFAIKKRIPKVVFIHGIGDGVLKLELEYLLGRYNNVKFYEANYKKYGLGATEVYIYQNSQP